MRYCKAIVAALALVLLAAQARALLVDYADGDARRLLNMLEQIAVAAQARDWAEVDEAFVRSTLALWPDEALVFEDSPSGMRAAKAAGIFGFGILTGLTAEEMAEVGADRSITDFHDPALWEILEERLGRP